MVYEVRSSPVHLASSASQGPAVDLGTPALLAAQELG